MRETIDSSSLGYSVAFSLVLLLGSCGDEKQQSRGRGFGADPGGAAPESGQPGASGAPAAKDPSLLPFTDDDFLESEKNRDPFRSYFALFRREKPMEIQRKVVMPRTDIDNVSLIAIITGVPRPKAMLFDKGDVNRIGHVVERGVYLGAPEIVQASENVAMTLNWRVHRIRDNEVVLIREDPTDPTRPALTRVLPLREENKLKLKPI